MINIYSKNDFLHINFLIDACRKTYVALMGYLFIPFFSLHTKNYYFHRQHEKKHAA